MYAYSDYLGFHTQDYARHFLTSCRRLLTGTEITPSSVKYKNHLSMIGTHPIGIEPNVFRNTLKKESCKEKLADVIASFGRNMKVIIAVDRLDMIKGIPHRLLGYQAMLRMRPMWREQVVLIQVAVPSRTDVPAYQTLTRQVNILVGEINQEVRDVVLYAVHTLILNRSLFLCSSALYHINQCIIYTSKFFILPSKLLVLILTDASCEL